MFSVVFTVQTTQEQVKTFQAKSEEFNVKFRTEGPTCVGSDLDKGQLIMHTCIILLFANRTWCLSTCAVGVYTLCILTRVHFYQFFEFLGYES